MMTLYFKALFQVFSLLYFSGFLQLLAYILFITQQEKVSIEIQRP
jgi:hypothetical protein